MLNFFSFLPALPLVSSVSPSPKAKKLLSSFATSDYELLSTPKITTFLAKSLPKLHGIAALNAIP